MALALEYETTPIKASKSKNIKLTSRNQAIKGMGELGTPTIVWQLVMRHKVSLMFNFILLENVYLAAKFLGLM